MKTEQYYKYTTDFFFLMISRNYYCYFIYNLMKQDLVLSHSLSINY